MLILFGGIKMSKQKKIGKMLFIMGAVMALSFLFAVNVFAAEGGGPDSDGLAAGLGYIGAALAVGISGIGGGLAVGSGSAAAIGALTEDPTSFGKALIFVALGEGIALYGLIIAIMIVNGISA